MPVDMGLDISKIWDRLEVHSYCSYDNAIVVNVRDNPKAVTGTTGFFRYPELTDQLVEFIAASDFDHTPRILIAPSSIGCEPYSFAIRAQERGLFDRYPAMVIDALDINPIFVMAGRSGAYHPSFVKNVKAPRRNLFTDYEGASRPLVMLNENIRARVRFLPPGNITGHSPQEGPYDLAVCLHLVEHMTNAQKVDELMKGLLRISRTLCINHAAYISEGTLRRVFASFSAKAVFAPMDAGMLPLKPVSASASKAQIRQFLQPCNEANATFIHRCRA